MTQEWIDWIHAQIKREVRRQPRGVSKAFLDAFLSELAPVVERLVVATVQREVARALGADNRPAPPRAFLAGVMYQPGDVVQHGDVRYRAIAATLAEPGQSLAWDQVADQTGAT